MFSWICPDSYSFGYFFYCFLQFFKFTLRVIFIFIFQFCSAGLNSVSNIQDSVCWMHFLCTPVNSDL